MVKIRSRSALLVVPALAALMLLGLLLRPHSADKGQNARHALAAEAAQPAQMMEALPVPEPLPVPPPLSDRSAASTSPGFEEKYGKVLKRFSLAAQHPLDAVVGRLQYECYTALREVRLLSLIAPREMHVKCVAIIRNPTADPAERELAISALGLLARNGFKEAENELYILAKNDPLLAWEAIRSLAAVDRQGQYAALFRQRASEGVESAFDALSVRPAQDSLELMKGLRGEDKPVTSRFMAQKVLERFAVLTDADWQGKLKAAIENPRQGVPETLWAIRAADFRDMPGLLDSMRARLDRSETAARETLQQFNAGTSEQGQHRVDFKEMFTGSATVQGLWDDAFDDVLIAFAEKGGKLTELEGARLQTFGYRGSAEKRLEELLSEKR